MSQEASNPHGQRMPMSSHNEAEIYTPTDTIDQSIDEYDTEYPDGGSKAWLQVLSGNLCNALSWGLPASFGVFQLHYTETMHLPSSQVSWIGSIQVFLTFATCTIVGRLADSGYSRHCIFVGCAIIVSGTFITSICTAYWQILLAQGIYTGLGLGMVFMPTVAVIGCYFKRRRSLALSLSATGGGFGSLVFPSTVQYLIPQVGFPWAVRCAAFLALIMAIIANVCLCPRSMPTKPGPLVQLQAFREAPYFLFALSVFLYFLALYFGFFYVSYGRPGSGSMHADLQDQRVCPQRRWLLVHRGRLTVAHYQRYGHPSAADSRIHRRPLSWPHQHVHHCHVFSGLHGIRLDQRQNTTWHVHLQRLLWNGQRRGAGHVRRCSCQSDNGPARNGRQIRNDSYPLGIRNPSGASDSGRNY